MEGGGFKCWKWELVLSLAAAEAWKDAPRWRGAKEGFVRRLLAEQSEMSVDDLQETLSLRRDEEMAAGHFD